MLPNKEILSGDGNFILSFKATTIITLKLGYHKVSRITSGKHELKTPKILKYLYMKEPHDLFCIYMYLHFSISFLDTVQNLCVNTDVKSLRSSLPTFNDFI